MTSDFRPEVEIWPFYACAMHPAIIIGTVRSLWTRLWARYHVPQNAFLVTTTTTGGCGSGLYRKVISSRLRLRQQKGAKFPIRAM